MASTKRRASRDVTSRAGRVGDVILTKERTGWSGESAILPGAFGQGETRSEAVASVESAVKDLVETYRMSGERVPWRRRRA